MSMKAFALVMATVFLLTQIGCATVNHSQAQTNSTYSENPIADNFDAKWKKDEREWLLMAAIVLGLAIVLGAAIAASSGGNGLSIGINN